MTYCIFQMCVFIQKYKNMQIRKEKSHLTLYYCCLTMLAFFLFGYLFAFFAILTNNNTNMLSLMIALVFLFGAVFVFVMVRILLDNNVTSLEVMTILVRAIEMKDSYTRGHSQHVFDIIELFYDNLPFSMRRNINKSKLLNAAILHDLGKISIPDHILNKADKLSDDEWDVIKLHAINGRRILEGTSLKDIAHWVEYHHERMDGDGYYKLDGSDIPIEAKIISIADTYSALVTNRIYRGKYSHEDAIEIIQGSVENQFDPYLVELFCNLNKESLLEIEAKIENTNIIFN